MNNSIEVGQVLIAKDDQYIGDSKAFTKDKEYIIFKGSRTGHVYVTNDRGNDCAIYFEEIDSLFTIQQNVG